MSSKTRDILGQFTINPCGVAIVEVPETVLTALSELIQVAVMPELRAAPQRLRLPCVLYNTQHLTQTRTQAPAPSIYDEIGSPRVILASSLSVRQAG